MVYLPTSTIKKTTIHLDKHRIIPWILWVRRPDWMPRDWSPRSWPNHRNRQSTPIWEVSSGLEKNMKKTRFHRDDL